MRYILLVIYFLIPTVSFAQQIDTTNFRSLIVSVVTILLPIILSLLAVGILLYFIWRIAEFILHSDNQETRSSAQRVFLWGIITILVAASITAIIAFLLNEFGLGQPGIPKLPTG